MVRTSARGSGGHGAAHHNGPHGQLGGLRELVRFGRGRWKVTSGLVMNGSPPAGIIIAPGCDVEEHGFRRPGIRHSLSVQPRGSHMPSREGCSARAQPEAQSAGIQRRRCFRSIGKAQGVMRVTQGQDLPGDRRESSGPRSWESSPWAWGRLSSEQGPLQRLLVPL